MKLPDDLAAVFTTRMSSPCRSRRDLVSAPIRSCSREVGVTLQHLGTVSMEELDGYLSSPGVDSQPTEILEYDDFGYCYDYSNLDDFDEGYEDNYTPLFFSVFMADNETAEKRQAREAEEQRTRLEAERRRLEEERQAQERERLQREQEERERATKEAEDHRERALDAGRRARDLIGQQDVEGTAVFRTPQQNAVAAITLLDTLLQEDAPNHVVNILNQTKTMIAASVLRKRPYADWQPSSTSLISRLSSTKPQRRRRRSRDHGERSVHSPADRHRERRAEQPRSPRRRRPVDLRDTINQRRAKRGYIPHNSPDRYDDDVDGVDPSQATSVEWIGWPASSRLESRSMTAKQILSLGSPSIVSQFAQQEEIAKPWLIIYPWP
uniref:Retrotransposon protein, putative, Ty3-gypsy subclass n=1 Tax=Oryza sativa subsp. japonica TaxID=39947 RepID=Q10IL3_ORYSJ|nr:retrotransposon protein, putative, Ty3-gypsy subclass [Oryza sativa Japonica Group]